MKRYELFATFALTAVIGACNSSTASDPATTERSSLNPPTGLTSLTGDTKLTLRFDGANTEKDFAGYDVFIVAKKMADIGKTADYPSSAQIDPTTGVSQSIPRCVKNTGIFEAFGFPATKAECTGGGATSAAGSSDSSLRLDDAAASDPTPTNMVLCDEGSGDKTVSLPLKRPILGPETCTISKTADGKALVNGTTYSIFVAAVAGDKKNKLSWTSNFVQDTPAAALFSGNLVVAATDTDGVVYRFDVATLKATTLKAYSAAPTASTKTCTDYAAPHTSTSSPCKVNKHNTAYADFSEDGIYFGRAAAGTFNARVFLSVPAGGALKILQRGPRITIDPGTGSVTSPGVDNDHAITDPTSSSPYDSSGTLYPIYGYQVFDFVLTQGSGTSKTQNYGKIVINGKPSLATATSDSSAETIPVTIIMQPGVGVTDYFTGPSEQEAAVSNFN